MAVELISKIKPKNNGDFKLVDVEDIDYNGTSLAEAIEDLLVLPEPMGHRGRKVIREKLDQPAQQGQTEKMENPHIRSGLSRKEIRERAKRSFLPA